MEVFFFSGRGWGGFSAQVQDGAMAGTSFAELGGEPGEAAGDDAPGNRQVSVCVPTRDRRVLISR